MDAVRIAEVVEKILEDLITKGLNRILEEHINPKLDKLDLLEEILAEIRKQNSE